MYVRIALIEEYNDFFDAGMYCHIQNISERWRRHVNEPIRFHFQIKFERLQVLQKKIKKKMYIFDSYGVNNILSATKTTYTHFR